MQTLTISGLHCEACVKLLTKKLFKINSVINVTPGLKPGEFAVESAQTLTADTINQALAGTEYTLVDIK